MDLTFAAPCRLLQIALIGCVALTAECLAQNTAVPNPVLATAPPAAAAISEGEFVNAVYEDEKGPHKFVVYVPANYASKEKWPVILFLHGACNRGTDGRSQLVSGLAPSIRLQLSSYPFLVVFPQCEDTESRVLGGWTDQPDDADRAMKMLEMVENQYKVDKSHECLVGLSMGGTGAWDIAARTPNRWRALVAVSAMASTDDAPKLAGIPAWVFHATSDPLVPTHVARNMVTAVNESGGRAYFTEVTKRAHDLSNVVFTQKALTEWMLDPSGVPTQDLTWEEPHGYSTGMDLEVPFVPGAEMTRAVRLRLCKDVLEAFCYAAPEKLAARPMEGHVGGMYQSAKVGGFMSVDVALSGLHYKGHVERIKITPKANNRLILRAGLRNLTMTVENSQVNGKMLFSASASPIHVVIGPNEPVWLTVELQPYVKDHHVYLNPVGMNFQIPDNNWYVTKPADVYVRGMPFISGKVSSGLTNGIYARKGEFERQVLNNVPRLVQTLEAKLNDQLLSKTVSVGQISMPIWQPRMRTLPEEVVVDDDGITIVSSVILSTLGHVPSDFQIRKYEAPVESPPAIKTGMEICVSETVVPAWSELIVAGRVNHFNVHDFTPPEYHRIADREFLQEIIPDLKKFGDELEANVDFQLRDPIHLLDPENPKLDQQYATPGNGLVLSLSSVPLHVAMRKKGERKWTPVGELDLRIDREYAPYVKKAGFARRGAKFAERSPFMITSKWSFAPGYQAENTNVDEAKFVAQVLKAREAAQLLEGVKPDSVQDVVLNGVPLRMDTMDWVKKHLIIQYQLPGVLIKNDSEETMTYDVSGPYTQWSDVRTLPPGVQHEYHVPYPLTWRHRLTNESQNYTLPIGQEFSFQTSPKRNMIAINPDAELSEERIMSR